MSWGLLTALALEEESRERNGGALWNGQQSKGGLRELGSFGTAFRHGMGSVGTHPQSLILQGVRSEWALRGPNYKPWSPKG